MVPFPSVALADTVWGPGSRPVKVAANGGAIKEAEIAPSKTKSTRITLVTELVAWAETVSAPPATKLVPGMGVMVTEGPASPEGGYSWDCGIGTVAVIGELQASWTTVGKEF